MLAPRTNECKKTERSVGGVEPMESGRVSAAVCSEPQRTIKRAVVEPTVARKRIALGLFLGASLLLVTAALPHAVAQRQHRVRSGQTMARIARRYRVRLSNLAGANSLRTTARLREGQVLVIPEENVAYVAVGQTLSHVARANNVTVAALRRANRLRDNAVLQPGQRLVLPGYENAAAAAAQYGRPRNPGVVTFFRALHRETLRIRVLDSRGRPRGAARRRLTHLMRARQSGEEVQVHPRLMRALVQVSDHFGGRKIYVVSGYRAAGGFTRESSRHTQGRAIDLRVHRVSNAELRDYCRQLPNAGVGYYPNSSFVHLDVRDRSVYWVDYSGPGEAPRYRRGTMGADASTGAGGNDAAPGTATEMAAPAPSATAE